MTGVRCQVCGRVLAGPAELVSHYELRHPAPARTWSQPRLPFNAHRVHRVGR